MRLVEFVSTDVLVQRPNHISSNSEKFMRSVIALTVGALTLALAGAWADYLPAIGPSPLRFRATATAVESPKLSWLIELPGPTTAAATNGPVAVAFVVPNLPTPVVEPDTIVVKSPFSLAALTAGAPTNDFAGAISGSTQHPLLTPQMMSHFFQQPVSGSNSPRAGIVMPVSFTPPHPIVQPASKVTYTTP